MALLDWIFVVVGAAIALAGGWIQLYPERVVPGRSGPSPNLSGTDWQLDPGPRSQIRLLGASFVFMGTFFALQMTIDLARCPWWIGTLGGVITSVAAVTLVNKRVRRQQRRRRSAIQQAPLAEKMLELR